MHRLTIYMSKHSSRLTSNTVVSLSISLSMIACAGFISPCHAVAKSRGGHGGGGGGVFLTTPNPTNPLEHNNRAVELGMKGLWPNAIQEHQIALEGDPENLTFRKNLSSAFLHYGDVLRAKSDFANAIENYRKALFTDPANNPADTYLDFCLHQLGKAPLDPSYRLDLAQKAETTPGHFEDAVVEYRKLTKISDSGINRYRLGRCLIKGGKILEGYEECIIALRRDWPKDEYTTLSECHTLLGDTLKEFAYKAKTYPDKTCFPRRLNNAAMEYRRAVTINPSNAEAIRGLCEVGREAVAANPSFRNQLLLGGAYLLGGDFDHAKLCYEKAWRAEPTNPDLQKARIAFHQSVVESPLASPLRVAETVQKVEELTRLNPNDAQLFYILGIGRDRQGDRAGAIAALQKAVEINKFVNPKLVPTLNGFTGQGPAVGTVAGSGTPATATAGALGTAGNSAGAAATAAAAAGAGKPAAPAADYSKVESLMRDNKLDEATKEADNLLTANPKDGKAWLMRGLILQKQGTLDDAATCFRQADGLKAPEAAAALNQINTERVLPLMNDADKLISSKDYPGASAVLREAVILAPSLAKTHRKLGEILKLMGDDKEAARETKKADDLEKAK